MDDEKQTRAPVDLTPEPDGECRYCGRPYSEHETSTWKTYAKEGDS